MKKAMAIAFLLIIGFVGHANAREIVIIGGSGASAPELELFRDRISGTIVIEPEKRWPLADAAFDVLRQLKEKGISGGGLVLVGFSWGGLVARQLDADNSGLAEKVITVGSPAGGFRFSPGFIFKPSDSGSSTPLYVIGGYESSLPSKWYMTGEENDGVVSLESVLAVGRPAETTVFGGVNHIGLLKDADVARQIREWIAHPDRLSGDKRQEP